MFTYRRDPARPFLSQPLARFFSLCLALCAITLALFARISEISAVKAASNSFPATISFQSIATGLSQPVHITHAGDGSSRLFITERAGRIRVYKNGSLLATPFLSITARVLSAGPEQGLLSVAFPPNYAAKGWFYVYYTDLNGNLQISRFRITANPDVADPNSEQMVLNIPHPGAANHNGGQLQFGRDGFLYLGTGDGGGGGDLHGPIGNAQNPGVLLGKMLRINVEPGYNPPAPPLSFTPAHTLYLPFITAVISPPVTYTIPITNPFVGNSSYRSEIWGLGLRNPWRFAFDRLSGDLYIGDVGQNCYEEIDYTPAISSGLNYGWRLAEGFHRFDPNNQSNCNQPLSTLITLTKPITEYSHSFGCAVIGGYVYRGLTYSNTAIAGTYFYGDECSGRVWGAQQSGGVWATTQLTDTGFIVSSFGEDENGELYLADYDGGVIYKIRTP